MRKTKWRCGTGGASRVVRVAVVSRPKPKLRAGFYPGFEYRDESRTKASFAVGFAA